MTTTHSATRGEQRTLRRVVAVARGLVGLAILAAIIATYLDAAAGGPVNPFNFFGFFTIQSNVLAVIVTLGLAVNGLTNRPTSRLFAGLRTVATVDMVITGIVYATLLAPTHAAGGVAIPWANAVMHTFGPLYLAIDWFVLGDRPALAWRSFWVALIHPLIWLPVVLFRGATDGWVPYPFLNPSQGYPAVAMYCAIITVAFIVVGSLVWWSSHRPSLLARRTSTQI